MIIHLPLSSGQDGSFQPRNLRQIVADQRSLGQGDVVGAVVRVERALPFFFPFQLVSSPRGSLLLLRVYRTAKNLPHAHRVDHPFPLPTSDDSEPLTSANERGVQQRGDVRGDAGEREREGGWDRRGEAGVELGDGEGG